MLDAFKRIDVNAMLDLQNLQYQERLYMEANVPAGEQLLVRTNVSSLGHFACLWMTGGFTTLSGQAVDDGVSYLRGKLIDGSNQRTLFDDFIPLDLWLSPGRILSTVAAGDQPGNLFVPTEFNYIFPANSEIQLDVINDSDYANRFKIVFHGIRIKSSVSVQGVRDYD